MANSRSFSSTFHRSFIKSLCRRSVGFFIRALLVFLMKESKKRRRKQPGRLMAKSCSQPVNLPSARPLMNPLLSEYWAKKNVMGHSFKPPVVTTCHKQPPLLRDQCYKIPEFSRLITINYLEPLVSDHLSTATTFRAESFKFCFVLPSQKWPLDR